MSNTQPVETLQNQIHPTIMLATAGLPAWLTMREHFPEEGDEILDMLVVLDRIRRRTEKEFPDARSFVRPGFDTEPALA